MIPGYSGDTGRLGLNEDKGLMCGEGLTRPIDILTAVPIQCGAILCERKQSHTGVHRVVGKLLEPEGNLFELCWGEPARWKQTYWENNR